MTDAGFPVINYSFAVSPRANGWLHGEQHRQAIAELAGIRRDLMVQKNPGLTSDWISRLAAEQWAETVRFAPLVAEEVAGIAEGAALPLEDLVVLNNYTDFRDLVVPDQGCSVIYVNRQDPVAGQTWDMHASAKNYACSIRVPHDVPLAEQIVFSLVGCVGLMGFNGRGLMVGVNNINSNGARPGVLWPVLVRTLLSMPSLAAMRECLTGAPVTSGHTYLLGSRSEAEFWEVMPDLAEMTSRIALPERGHLFHTNHCLGQRTKARELTAMLSSTTHIRYGLLEKKIGAVATFDDAVRLLNDHENYPMAICSNYQSGAQDPSVTCGGAVGDLKSGKISMWRGDEMYDANFVRHEFQLENLRG